MPILLWIIGAAVAGGIAWAATRDEEEGETPADAWEVVDESVGTHPVLGTVSITISHNPASDLFTWDASWSGGAEPAGVTEEGERFFESPVDARLDAEASLAEVYGPWVAGFGSGASETGYGTFDYEGATITIANVGTETIGGRVVQWSATGPDLDMGGVGTAGTATAATDQATYWVDTHTVA